MKNLFTIFATLFVLQANAQQETNLLRAFQYRTNGYVGINLVVDSKSQNKSESYNKINQNDYRFNLIPNLFGQYITDKIQLSYSTGLYISMNYTKGNENSILEKNSNFSLAAPLFIDFKNFDSKNRFIGASINEATNYITTNSYSSSNELKQESLYNQLNPALVIGKGRINNANPMDKALWIIRDLKSEHLLTSELSEQEIISFANTLIQIENTRMFDYRRKNKWAFEQLLEQLTPYINNENKSKVFNVIQDNYYFAMNMERNQGKEIFAKAELNAYKQYWKTMNNDLIQNSNSRFFSPRISMNYNCYKALSLQKQINYGGSIYASTQSNNNTLKSTFANGNEELLRSSYNNKAAGIGAYMQYVYYPSTRSNIIAGLRSNFELAETSNYVSILPFAQLNYMFNYRMRLQASVNENLYSQFGNPTNSKGSVFNTELLLIYNFR